MSFFRKSGIVNVKMVITEEKIVSNIDKIQKLINPNSKKQIVQLNEDTYFKDLVESVKTYLTEYPKKATFPLHVYQAAYDLVEYSTTQFEENTKKIEDLIRKREKNIKKANVLSTVLKVMKKQSENSRKIMKKVKKKYSKDIIDALNIVGTAEKNSEEYKSAVSIIKAKIGNLESNTFVEIDIERIEDKSKALSFIGIEISEALKDIPVPESFALEQAKALQLDDEEYDDKLVDESVDSQPTSQLLKEVIEENIESNENNNVMNTFLNESEASSKPSLWQRIKESKLVKAIKFITKIRIRVEIPALPEGRG